MVWCGSPDMKYFLLQTSSQPTELRVTRLWLTVIDCVNESDFDVCDMSPHHMEVPTGSHSELDFPSLPLNTGPPELSIYHTSAC